MLTNTIHQSAPAPAPPRPRPRTRTRQPARLPARRTPSPNARLALPLDGHRNGFDLARLLSEVVLGSSAPEQVGLASEPARRVGGGGSGFPVTMSKVRRIDVKTGFRCNNRCRFCVQGDKRFRFADKTTAEVKALLVEGRRDADEVVFTGGEVTIRKDLPELVDYARRRGFRVIQIQTNGRMLSHRPFVQRLVEAGVTEFAPALHGPNAEMHDALTRAPGSFRQTVKGVRNVKRLGVPVVMNSVITAVNYRSLPELAKLFVALEVDQFQFAFVHPLGTALENFEQIVPRLGEVQPYVLKGLDIGVQAAVRCMTEAVPLCFLPGMESFAAEAIIPRTKIFDAKMVVDDYTEFRLHQGKAKGEVCDRCRLDDRCEGPWREYPEHYGWTEFCPVR